MDKDNNDEIETMSDDEVFSPLEDTKEYGSLEPSIFESDQKVEAQTEEDIDDTVTIYGDELVQEPKEMYKEEKVKEENVKTPIKYVISLMMWLLFVILTAIVIYVIVNEPDAIKKVIDKIF